MYQPNNKNLNTKSNRLSKVTPVWKFILDTIDNCQEIKRLCRYITKTPLINVGTEYNGSIIKQPNLRLTLTESNTEGDKVLFDASFNPDVLTESNNVQIFLSPYDIRHKDNTTGVMHFMLNIVCDEGCNSLVSYGDKRIFQIANYICDLLDGYVLDDTNDVVEDVGNLKIEISGSVSYGRVSKTNNNVVLSMPVKVDFISRRGR